MEFIDRFLFVSLHSFKNHKSEKNSRGLLDTEVQISINNRINPLDRNRVKRALY